MIWGFQDSTVLAAGYALLLVGLAAILEWLGRGSHRFAERFHMAGFRFDTERDLWHCPEGQKLFRIASDPMAQVTVYQAPAHVCNACRGRPDCTDSDHGRQIERRLDSWLESELRRFHRGITVVLLVLASVILVWRMQERGELRGQMLLGGMLVSLSLAEIRLFSSLVGRPRSVEETAPRPE